MATENTNIPTPDPDEVAETYDVFIAHSSEDVGVSREIVEKLEDDHHLKCFHSDRDFMPGGSIVNNALQGIRRSRRVLLLVSEVFLDSNWFIFETQHALQKTYEKSERIMIPVLHNIAPEKVPSSLKEFNYLTLGEDDFWKKLLKAIGESLPLSSAIPAGNVAHGLAWSYFYGFLNLVLPGMAERVLKSEWTTDKKYSNAPILPKLLIILPKSCYCPGRFLDLDEESFEFAGAIPFNATRAGNINRDYKSSVYKVKCPDTGKEYHFLGEFATPLLSLFEMEQEAISGLNKEQKLYQKMLFHDKMKEILTHSRNHKCHDKSLMIDFDDETNTGGKHALARQIVWTIQHDLEKTAEVAKMADQVHSMQVK